MNDTGDLKNICFIFQNEVGPLNYRYDNNTCKINYHY